MTEIIKIKTMACPQCGFKPIVVHRDKVYIICPVCSYRTCGDGSGCDWGRENA